MRQKLLKRIFIIIALVIIVFVIHRIITIYAVFHSELGADVSGKMANWTIFVNNTDISSGKEQKFSIDTIQIEKNKNVKEGKIAPGLTGNFTITVEPKDTQVSVRYDIGLDISSLTQNNIQITSIEEITQGKAIVQTAENTYTGIIPLEEIQKGMNHIIRITLFWENNESGNENDTKLGAIFNGKLSIPVQVKVTQYTGEEVVAIK